MWPKSWSIWALAVNSLVLFSSIGRCSGDICQVGRNWMLDLHWDAVAIWLQLDPLMQESGMRGSFGLCLQWLVTGIEEIEIEDWGVSIIIIHAPLALYNMAPVSGGKYCRWTSLVRVRLCTIEKSKSDPTGTFEWNVRWCFSGITQKRHSSNTCFRPRNWEDPTFECESTHLN